MTHLQNYRVTEALWNVFVRSAISSQRPNPNGGLRCNAFPTFWRRQPSRLRPPLHWRPFSITSTVNAQGTTSSKREPPRRAQKWDEDITSFQIHLVDPTTNTLLPPRPRDNVLRSMDRSTHRLVQLDLEPTTNIPICKIISKKEMFDQEKQRRLANKERKAESRKFSSVKTLELNWAIDGNDLAHRLERVEEFLAEGRRVEIVLAAKKKGRKATTEECMKVLEKIKAVVGKVKGAKEFKGLEGKVGGFATLVLQGKSVSRDEDGETKAKSAASEARNIAEVKSESNG